MTSTTATPAVSAPCAPLGRLRLQTLAIMALCLLDGFLTLHVLQLGAVEWNPLMAGLLTYGPVTFLGVKLVWTLAGCAVLLMLGRHEVARRGMTTLLVAYICLTAYHLAGQAQYALAALG